MVIKNKMGLCQANLRRSSLGPTLEHWSLKNGVHCVLAPMPEAPLTCVDLWCKAGSSSEIDGEEGLAHFLEHMVFKGSRNLGAGEFDLKIEALGGNSNAATGFDDVHFYVLVPPSEALSALELLLDLVLTPTLDQAEYSTEREVVLEEIAQFKDQPDERISQQLLKNCWPNHPYGRPILGYESTLRKMNSEQMKAFHQRRYVAQNCCLSIAGDIPKGLDKIISNSLLNELSVGCNKNDDQTDLASICFQKSYQEIQVERLESARLLMAWPMPPAKNQTLAMGADIATSLLSEGRRSRLVQHLREELQIVESIDMDLTALEQGSLVTLEACCAEEQLNRVQQEIHHLLTTSLDDLLSNQEITRAQQLVRSGICFNLEASCQIAGLAGVQALWNRHQPLLEQLNYINSWSATRLQEEVLSKLQPELCCTLIASPKSSSQ